MLEWRLYIRSRLYICKRIVQSVQIRQQKDTETSAKNKFIFKLSVQSKTCKKIWLAMTFPFSHRKMIGMLNDLPYGDPDLYIVRETLTKTVEGRNIPMLTVTSSENGKKYTLFLFFLFGAQTILRK